MDENKQTDAIKTTSLDRLSANPQREPRNINENYSRFIRRVRFTLPILAILLIGLIIGWNNFEGNKIIPIQEEEIQPSVKQEIGKNELVNPRFESIDSKGQPFVLTADIATQENGEKGEMQLTAPTGNLALNNGSNLSISANQGAYHQIEQYLNLNGNVILTHSDGHKMQTERLNIDLAQDSAKSDATVKVTSPQGDINATGASASSNDQTLIFNGPAKMIININNESMSLGNMMP